MPPTVLGITGEPINPQGCNLGTIDINIVLDPAKFNPLDITNIKPDLDLTEPFLSRLKEWLNTCKQPALLGVEPEQPIYLYVYDPSNPVSVTVMPTGWSAPLAVRLDKNNNQKIQTLTFSIQVCIKISITVLGVTTSSNNPPKTISFSVLEIPAFIPDVATLQATSSQHGYIRNVLVQGMSLYVVNQAGEKSAVWLPFPVRFPPPLIQNVLIRGDDVTVGFLKDVTPDLSSNEIANYLGRKAHRDNLDDVNAKFGQLRWYGLDHLPRLEFFQQNQPLPPGSGTSTLLENLCLPLPDLIANKLAAVRQAGRWLYSEPDEIKHWDDNCVDFVIPRGEQGMAIIWRDDLPSMPIVRFDVLKYVEELANRLWQPVLGSGRYEAHVPIPIGEAIQLGVERLEEAINNELVEHIGNGLTVQFAFLTNPYKEKDTDTCTYTDANLDVKTNQQAIGQKVDPANFLDSLEPGKKGVSSTTVDFSYIPQVLWDDLNHISKARSGAFSVQLSIILTCDIKILGYQVKLDHHQIPIGPEIIFEPEPIKLPTLAIFFYHPNFKGPALVMLPANTGLFGNHEVHIDANTPGQFNQERMQLVSEISRIKGLLDLVKIVWNPPLLQTLSPILDEVCALGQSAVDSHGTIENLNGTVVEKRWYWWDATFNDSISSAILIGAPYQYTKQVVNCYENPLPLDPKNPGRKLRLLLPDKTCFAAIPTFSDLRSVVVPPSTTPLPQPYGDQPGDKPTAQNKDFNDSVSAIQFVTE